MTEKPSVAMAYAKVLGVHGRQDGYLEGSGYLVSWCVGHLVELAPPSAYGEQYVKWSICNELFTWADVYDTANHDERRAILQQFIKEIRVRKDYEISITLNASFEQVEQLKAVSTYDGAEIFEEISEKGA